ncbi:MAG: hypothetical protein PHP32_05260 [Candidatus Izemoplasmatales bacterium]|nr:hypothetical protein [Candidatus Izemoplasmatales bacterium]
MNNILGLVVSVLFITLILGISTLCLHLRWFSQEASRKFIHIGVSNWWIIAMIFFDVWYWASIVPAIFIVLNTISYKTKLVKAMERGENDSLGTIYYPISLLVLTILFFGFFPEYRWVGLIGVLVMGYGDGFAAIIGKNVASRKLIQEKSLAGSLSMFLISWVVSVIPLMLYLQSPSIYYAFLVALIPAGVATLLELFSHDGIDNLTVPIGTSVILFLLLLLL